MLVMFIRIFLFSSWASLYFIPKKAIKRFLPVTTMSALLTMTIVFVGTQYNFWKIKGNKKAKIYNLLAIVLGGFSVGTMWIFKLTFGKFWLYLLTNLIQNLIYSIPIISYFTKVNFIKYTKFTRIHHFLVAMTLSVILYGYQWYIEKTDNSPLD